MAKIYPQALEFPLSPSPHNLKLVLNWLNPFKWWQRFQQNRRWKVASRQFICYYYQRDFVTAETVAKSMVDLATESGKRKLRLESYYNLILCYRELEQLDLAIDYCEQVLDLQRALSSSSEDPILVERICDLADLLQRQGKMEDAIKLYGEASTIRKRIDCGRGSKQAIEILESLAAIYVTQSNEDRAEKSFKEAQLYRHKLGLVAGRKVDELESAIEQIKSRHRGEYLTDVEQWENLDDEAMKLYKQGEIATAICIAEQALQLAQENFPSQDPNLAYALNTLAVCSEAQGSYNRAELLHLSALEISETSLGTDHPNVAMSLSGLAGLYWQWKLYDRAEHFYLRALKVYEAYQGKDFKILGIFINNLGLFYVQQGSFDRGKSLLLHALKIFETSLGKNHSLVATALDNLAELYKSQRLYDDAEQLCLRALKINETILDRNHPDLATTINNLAEVYCLKGLYDRAEPLFLKTLKIRSARFGETGHPELVSTSTTLALNYARQLKISLALPLFQQVIVSENTWLTNVIAINDAERRMEDLKQRETHLEYLLALTQQYFRNDPQVVADTFNAVLSRKALAATAEASFSKALRNYPHLAPQIEQYKTYQQEIANLSHEIGSQPELKDRLNAVLQQKRDLEKNLARSIPAIDLAQQVIDRQALTELLPADTFLVEFVRYDDYDFIKEKWQPARYLAFIVRHDREGVTAIDCGLAQPLDAAIDKFRLAYADTKFNGESSNFSSAKRNTSSTASTATLAPAPTIVQPDLLALLLPHFPTTGTCYVAPDSKLHILPFHLLETSEGKYLGDRYHLHYLTTARDLYRRNFPVSANPPIILADPDYDGGIIPTVAVSLKTGMQSNHDVNGAAFEPLPINQILGDRVAASYDVPCYSGLEATVDRLEQLNAPRLLVIATHGFSQPSLHDLIDAITECKPEETERTLLARQHEVTQEFRDFWQALADAGNEWSQQLLVKIDKIGIYKSTDLLATPISDPMLRSGIALAGANIWRFQRTPDPKFGKGVAFAQDIAQWDLWGTELALMITCVSGLGEVRNSEGVFGLRRALSIAGAKYTISSLWNIPTKPSVLLMDKFFELYQSEDRPTPPQALAQAQTYVRNITLGELKQLKLGQSIVEELQRETVRKLLLTATDDVKPLADPHFWGAWICQG